LKQHPDLMNDSWILFSFFTEDTQQQKLCRFR